MSVIEVRGGAPLYIRLNENEVVLVRHSGDNRSSLSIAATQNGQLSLNGEGLTPENLSFTPRTPLDWKEARDPVREAVGHSVACLINGEKISGHDLQTDLRHFATKVMTICVDSPEQVPGRQQRKKIIEILCQLEAALQQF